MRKNISQNKSLEPRSKLICALCDELIKKRCSISWLPEYDENGKPEEIKPYHFKCGLKMEPPDLDD